MTCDHSSFMLLKMQQYKSFLAIIDSRPPTTHRATGGYVAGRKRMAEVWALQFRITTVLLMILEGLGCWIRVKTLRKI